MEGLGLQDICVYVSVGRYLGMEPKCKQKKNYSSFICA